MTAEYPSPSQEQIARLPEKKDLLSKIRPSMVPVLMAIVITLSGCSDAQIENAIAAEATATAQYQADRYAAEQAYKEETGITAWEERLKQEQVDQERIVAQKAALETALNNSMGLNPYRQVIYDPSKYRVMPEEGVNIRTFPSSMLKNETIIGGLSQGMILPEIEFTIKRDTGKDIEYWAAIPWPQLEEVVHVPEYGTETEHLRRGYIKSDVMGQNLPISTQETGQEREGYGFVCISMGATNYVGLEKVPDNVVN
ncbi:MAG: hypothetical protein ACOX6V_02195 [Patescibacteria group bacterium]|jgi:hypothetical protein